MNLGFSNVVVIDKYEIPQPFNQINGSFYTGIDEPGQDPECIVFPNPAKDKVFISLPGQQIESVKLISTSGASMSFPYNQTGEFAINHLANGIYMLEITNEAKVLRKRIVINR